MVDEKVDLAQIIEFDFDKEENTFVKGENACYHIFSFSQNVFRSLLPYLHKNLDCVVKV